MSWDNLELITRLLSAHLDFPGDFGHSRSLAPLSQIGRVLVNTLAVCETVTSILIRIQVMSKEGRIYVHEKDSYSTHTVSTSPR